jgi:hypothetical protein
MMSREFSARIACTPLDLSSTSCLLSQEEKTVLVTLFIFIVFVSLALLPHSMRPAILSMSLDSLFSFRLSRMVLTSLLTEKAAHFSVIPKAMQVEDIHGIAVDMLE